MTRIFNFSGHSVTEETRKAISEQINDEVFIVHVQLHIDFRNNVYTQIKELVNPYKNELTRGEIMIIPPALSSISVLVFAYIHGIIGRFPTMLSLKSIGAQQSIGFITDLNRLRNEARQIR